MSYRPNYVPKKRRLNYKIVVPLVVLFLLLAYVVHSVFFAKQQEDETGFVMCGMSRYETRQFLKERQAIYEEKGTTTFEDYGMYGESLSFYETIYNSKQPDKMLGKTVFLTNLCSKDLQGQHTYLMGKELDTRIYIGNLEDGVYEVDLLEDIEYSRLMSNSVVDETFYSVRRDGFIKRVRLVSDKTLFDVETDKVLKEHYTYLIVDTIEDNNEVDVVIDPQGGTLYDNGTVNYGHTYKNMNEYNELYTMALKVKSELERHGLRVAITRDNQSGINAFGEGGRIHNAYKSGAKYYVQLRLETSGSQMDRGLLALYSNFSTNRFANNLIKSLTSHTSMQVTPYIDGDNMAGVFQTQFSDGLDYSDIIRETGGKFTGAATKNIYDTLMSFAKEERHGMQTVSLLYGYMTNEKDLDVWNSQQDALGKATAEGILNHLRISIKE